MSRIDVEESELAVVFDGREVIYGFTELVELVLAYATTIQFTRAKARNTRGLSSRWSRSTTRCCKNLVYTGVTRGKRLVVLVGQRKALAIAVKGGRVRRRWSKLREWLMC